MPATYGRGLEDTGSEAARGRGPAGENHAFSATDAGTRVDVEQHVVAGYERRMADAWPEGLRRLKALCKR